MALCDGRMVNTASNRSRAISQRVAQRRGLDGGDELPQALPRVEAGGAQPVRIALRRAGARDDHLGHARRGHFFEQPVHRARAIRHPMGLAAPVAVGREGDQPRVERGRRRERRGDRDRPHGRGPARRSRALRRDARGRGARPGTAAHTARSRARRSRSRRVSRSVASTISSRNPGCPRLSTSTSA